MVQVESKPFPCCSKYPKAHTKACLVRKQLHEVISGILSHERAHARFMGIQQDFTIQISIPQIYRRLIDRLLVMYAGAIVFPTYNDMVNYWLPNLGIEMREVSQAVLQVKLPPSRKAHAR